MFKVPVENLMYKMLPTRIAISSQDATTRKKNQVPERKSNVTFQNRSKKQNG